MTTTPTIAISVIWLPGEPILDDKGVMICRQVAKPCPEYLTEPETIRYLRLDEMGLADPKQSLTRLREDGSMKAIPMSKRLVFRRVDLDEFMVNRMKENPR